MSDGKLLLETTLLNSFVGEDSWTYVRVGDSFVKKKARDLQEGDSVVVNNEAIHKTLEDIEPVLEQSVRYSIAQRTLHEQNRNGQDIKRFRILLLRGFTDTNTPNLEQKIMQESDDFSPQEYSAFRSMILQYVSGVGESAVQEWLRGNTLAPRDWNNFARLSPINAEFQHIADSFGRDIGYYAAYQLYVGLRRTIMSYIAKRTGVHSNRIPVEHESNADTSGKYKQEIEQVVSHFLQEVDKTRSTARIIRIKHTETPKEKGHAKVTPEPHLTKGVVTEQLNVPVLNMNEVRDFSYILNHALYDALNLYTLARNQKIDDLLDVGLSDAIIIVPLFTPYTFTRLVKKAPVERDTFESNLEGVLRLLRLRRDYAIDVLNKEVSNFLDKLKDGEVDKILGVEYNTVANLVDLVNHYRNALPKSHFDAVNLRFHLICEQAYLSFLAEKKAPRELRRKKEKEILKMSKRLESLKRYNEETYSLSEKSKSLLIPYINDRRGLLKDGDLKEIPTQELARLKRQYESEGVQFYTKGEVMRMLNKFGIGQAIKIYNPKSFV